MHFIRLGAASIFALAVAQVAHAEDMTPANAGQAQGAPAAQSSPGLQDIVVTARRSAETMQSVPVAITALSGQFLERQNVVDATSIPQFAPNLTIAQQPSSLSAASVFIRGIGNNEPSAVSEQGVGIYLDGVYLARAAGAVFDLVDLDRIEVLRGPQGTLFGRNTIGGALQFVSRKPTDTMHLTAKAGLARYNDWYVRGRLDTGYIGNSTVKASIAYQHRQNDGYVNNVLVPGSQDPGSLKANSVAVAVEGDFGKLKANYNFDFDYREGVPGFFQLLAASPEALSYYSQSPNFGGAPFQLGTSRLQNVQVGGFTDNQGRYRYDSRTRVWGNSLSLAYEALPELTLKSITGYREFFQDTIEELNGNGVLMGQVVDFTSPTLVSVQRVMPFGGNNAPQKEYQVSQELQALGKSGDFNYLAGLYYFDEHSSEYNNQTFTIVSSPAALTYLGFPASVGTAISALNPGLSTVGVNVNSVQAFSGTANSMAVFGQVSWKPSALDEKLELTAGGRYTADHKTLVLAGSVQPNQSGRVNFSNFSWLGSASYHFNRDVMAYFRASTGYRSGGINPRTNVINTFAPEKATAYEAGIKSEFFRHRLRLNLATYLTNYDNMQIQQFAAGSGGATSLIVNAGEVQLKGFEAEFAAAPVKGLSFDGSIGYVDTT